MESVPEHNAPIVRSYGHHGAFNKLSKTNGKIELIISLYVVPFKPENKDMNCSRNGEGLFLSILSPITRFTTNLTYCMLYAIVVCNITESIPKSYILFHNTVLFLTKCSPSYSPIRTRKSYAVFIQQNDPKLLPPLPNPTNTLPIPLTQTHLTHLCHPMTLATTSYQSKHGEKSPWSNCSFKCNNSKRHINVSLNLKLFP